MKTEYFSEWADKVSFSRASRAMGIPVADSPPPEHFTPEDVEWVLKLVAHMEGGPEPDSPDAVPVELVLEERGEG